MNEEGSSKKIWIILAGALVLILIGIAVFVLIGQSSGKNSETGGTKGVGSLFGLIGGDTPRPADSTIHTGSSTGDGTSAGSGVSAEPLFRQLSTVQVAGATSIVHDGKTFVRYIARENGFVYEVDPMTGSTKQLTNTTIPRVYEAYWGNNGNSVVIRFLFKDPLTKKDIIETEIGDLALPVGSSSSALGSLEGLRDRLPDNISSVSISPNGKYLLYLLPVEDGISGSIVTLATRNTQEVLRNPFSEWLPQILDDGNLILTTKPSWNVPGFSYLYTVKNKALSRLIREKNGLTTLGNATGKRLLYSEDVGGNTILSMYDATGFTDEDNQTSHITPLQLATLPEKCAWSSHMVRIFCAAFAAPTQNNLPDDWYQGAISLQDTFWTINTDSGELVYLADPQKEISQSFDVMSPFIGGDENHLFFINKNDFTLWSMHLLQDKYESSEESALETNTPATPELTPEEMKDAAGSAPTSSLPLDPSKTKTPAKKVN